MIIVKSPFRVSFFGGSTDYESFYKEFGSFIIGTTINKYVYLSMRKRPSILSSESVIVYSQLQTITSFDEIHNPLIKEILKYKNIDFPLEFTSFSDVPSRTGLGGSSAFCVGMLYLINKILERRNVKRDIVREAIHIERNILSEPGGIQDSIWPLYSGLNTIEIHKNGRFMVKPVSITEEFMEEFENSMIMIYTNDQRNQDSIAKSHENKDKNSILSIAKEAHKSFLSEDIKSIGKLMYLSWMEKRKISNLVSTQKIDEIVNEVMEMGAYGTKLLGSGGCGFLLVLCDPIIKKKIIEKFRKDILEIKLDKDGVSQIYPHNVEIPTCSEIN